MKTSYLTIAVLVFSFIGLADAWYLGNAGLNNAPVACDIAVLNGCDSVLSSPYAHFIGIPLGVYGALFYAAVFMLAAIALILPGRHVYMPLFYLTSIGAGISLILAVIQVTLIKALCVYCLISGLTSFVLFGISLIFFLRFRTRKTQPIPESIPRMHLPRG